MRAKRVVGDPNIQLPDPITQVAKDKRLYDPRVGLKLCLTSEGVPESVEVITSSGVPPIDAFVRQRVLEWRYQPYTVNGQNYPSCTGLNFEWHLTPPPPPKKK